MLNIPSALLMRRPITSHGAFSACICESFEVKYSYIHVSIDT